MKTLMTSQQRSVFWAGASTLVLLVALMTGPGCKPSESAAGAGENPNPEKTAVEVTRVASMEFEETLLLQGTVESKTYALIPAKIGGTVEQLLVEEGARVKAGEALCELDHENLERAVETRRQELAVADSSLDVSRAQEDRARADFDQAEKDYQRFKELLEDDAVSIQQFEEVETGWKNARAIHQVAQAQVTLAEARVKQAETALAIAERNLQDATVRAPIGGVISEQYRELGEMVESGKPVFRIDNPEVVEISVFAPAEYYTQVRINETELRVNINGAVVEGLKADYKSPTIDPMLRTFEVKATLSDPPPGVVAGSMAKVELILQRTTGIGVPRGAVIQRNGQSVVFIAEQGMARKYPVKTGLDTDGFFQILEGLPAADAEVISKGQDLVNDGDAILVVGE
jgi:RND family efflux transporter MFP subunit